MQSSTGQPPASSAPPVGCMGRDPTPQRTLPPGIGFPASPTATRRPAPAEMDGQTPNAKRPADVEASAGIVGPTMSEDALNAFVYALHYKVESMEKLASAVQAWGSDHAQHIDAMRIRSTSVFESLQATAAQAETDTRIVMAKAQANDDQLCEQDR